MSVSTPALPASAISTTPTSSKPAPGKAALETALARAGCALIVDLDAVRSNFRTLRNRAGPGCEVAGVVKAGAYGMGSPRIAAALATAGCRTFFVATPDEGAGVREAVPDASVYVLAGGAALPAKCDLIPVLNHPGDAERRRTTAARAGRPLAAAVHVDTGMNRLGYEAADWRAFCVEPDRRSGLDICIVMSHLTVAEIPGHPLNAEQLARFEAARELAPFAARASLANSSGIWLPAAFRFDMARAGAALFGINPTPARPNPMAAVARLVGRIHQVRSVDRGEGVGYGHTWVSPGARRIATVSAGYADGYPRHLGNAGRVAIGGHVAPVVGRISMDLVTVDVSGVPDPVAQPGAVVDLLGPLVPVDDVAAHGGTIGYEILARLGSRVPRLYVD